MLRVVLNHGAKQDNRTFPPPPIGYRRTLRYRMLLEGPRKTNRIVNLALISCTFLQQRHTSAAAVSCLPICWTLSKNSFTHPRFVLLRNVSALPQHFRDISNHTCSSLMPIGYSLWAIFGFEIEAGDPDGDQSSGYGNEDDDGDSLAAGELVVSFMKSEVLSCD